VSATRREARERALGLLYEAEAREVAPANVLDGLPVAPDPYAAELVVGVGDDQEDIDDLIRRFAKDWKLERMPSIDRAVLRMAIHELLSRPEVPTGVVISEAVELVKQYSTDESGRFVNGLLSRIAAEVRPSP
jgi:transcription antitermination protein NusB